MYPRNLAAPGIHPHRLLVGESIIWTDWYAATLHAFDWLHTVHEFCLTWQL